MGKKPRRIINCNLGRTSWVQRLRESDKKRRRGDSTRESKPRVFGEKTEKRGAWHAESINQGKEKGRGIYGSDSLIDSIEAIKEGGEALANVMKAKKGARKVRVLKGHRKNADALPKQEHLKTVALMGMNQPDPEETSEEQENGKKGQLSATHLAVLARWQTIGKE